MRDTIEQDQLEIERAQSGQVLPLKEGNNLSAKDLMQNRLINLLHKDSDDPDDKDSLDVLLILLKDDETPDDDIFTGKHGNYVINDGFVGANLFKDGQPNNSPENINGLLELAAIAKEAFGDQTLFANGSTDLEQQQMNSYAAKLAGLNIGNPIDNSTLSPQIKAQMDVAWQSMQAKLGNDMQPELGPNMGQSNDFTNQIAPHHPMAAMQMQMNR
ncbi:MAG: hypothetical protein GW778_00065 [Alphaproteobacteria bacterium]|nr:hypothetical protein [Alphaproteobacteria bacterium]